MKRDEDAVSSPLSVAAPAATLGWLEVALPLAARWPWLAFGLLVGAALGFGLARLQPVGFTARASFVVQPMQRGSTGQLGAGLPALAGLMAGGAGAIDLHVAVLRSREVSERIVDRFDLQRVWGLAYRDQAFVRLFRSVDIVAGRREGVVYIEVADGHPQRAAAIANQYVEEIKAVLRGFALDEARQRRAYYDAQLARARDALAQAQRALQTSGFDGAALRAEPRIAAEAHARAQADVAAAEIRLAATRRVRAEGSIEVQQQLTEIATLRAQLGAMALPRDDGPGSHVTRVREYRFAEQLADAVARQAEAARMDETAEALPLQVLDRARPAVVPSRPRVLQWLGLGALAGLLLPAAVIVLRHRAALARLDPAYRERLDRVRSVLPARAGRLRWWARKGLRWRRGNTGDA